MAFWIFMMIMNLLVPLVMLVFGSYFRKHAPKKINGLYGYRTTMSMKNQDTWVFAHHYCGGIWRKIGAMLFVVTAIGMLLVLGKSEDEVGIVGLIICVIQLAMLIGSIVPTERALHRTFDKEGKRKDSI